MRLRDLLAGPAIVTAFLALFVYLMNEISAPNAPLSLANYLILLDLVVGFVLVMSVWSIVVHRESRLQDILPFRVPSYVGIPVVVVLFVFLYVTGLGELLLHVNEVISPALALIVAALILGMATYLDRRAEKRAGHHTAETGEDVEPEATAASEHEHVAASPSLPGSQHPH
jgi:Na+/alanine symporter